MEVLAHLVFVSILHFFAGNFSFTCTASICPDRNDFFENFEFLQSFNFSKYFDLFFWYFCSERFDSYFQSFDPFLTLISKKLEVML